MCVLKLVYVFGVFFAGYANGADNVLKQSLQEKLSCFMVNTAAKIHRSNTENKMYAKNIIFSPIDLYASTAIVYWGTTDDRMRQQLDTVLGFQTLEKFLEQHPEAAQYITLPPIFHQKNSRKKLALLKGEPSLYHNDDYENYLYIINIQLGNLFRATVDKEHSAIRSAKWIFVDNKFAVNQSFVKNVKNYYGIDVKSTYFETNPKLAIDTINQIVKNLTYDRIPNFIEKPLEKNTVSVMSSSLTLVTNWERMFQPDDSYETAFHTRDGECDGCDLVDICVMLNQGNIPYYADPIVTAIALPTATPEIRMYYVLPRDNQTLADILEHPNKNLFKKIIDGVEITRIIYSVPKMNFAGEVDQLDILRMHGLDKITLDCIAQGLTLSVFKQKVLLELNEEGIGGCPLMKSKKMPLVHQKLDTKAIEFTVDKPFLCFIYDTKTKMFLFYGAVFEPTGYTDF
ncbi:neuroserpin-like [Planococcus citri]|uniref:neuroserpin-like n=1 Tax=Planococcus citri TaxID=170843 RepID=UPI0031FA061F